MVFYGYAPALGFWLLKLYGHRDVRILDCVAAGMGGRGPALDPDAHEPSRTTGYALPEANGADPRRPAGRPAGDRPTRRRRCWTFAPTWNSAASGSGRPVARSREAGPVMCRRR